MDIRLLPYSEGQLVRLLGLHRYELRALLADALAEEAEADERVRLAH